MNVDAARLLPEDASLLAQYWAKADPTLAAAGHSHHGVLGHSLDVAACAFALVEQNPALRSKLAHVTGLPGDAVAPSTAAVCALHDIGKLDTRFQRKAGIADVLRPETQGIERVKYDHGTEGFRQIEDDEQVLGELEAELGDGALALLRAVCGHHGSLPTRDEPDPSRSKLPRAVRCDDERARRVFLHRVLAFFRSLGAQLPWPRSVDGALVQQLGGLCAVADWIGSNVAHFPYEPGPVLHLGEYWRCALDRAAQACSEAGLVRSSGSAVGFGQLFPGYSPRDVQLLTERIVPEQPSLVIVEAEMGKGKTEAALSLATRFFAASRVDGFTVALPTLATSNAMFSRVVQMLERLFPGERVELALAHSRAGRHEPFQALVRRGLRAEDADAPEASVACARWLLSRKRVLLAQFGVGTIDQLLQSALVVRHQFVRMFGLSRNVVIIDEVHAYDTYMEVLLEHLLLWLGALEVPVILLSATLPAERRVALTRAWLGGVTRRAGSAETAVPTLAQARAEPYPLVTVCGHDGVSTIAAPGSGSRKTIALERAETTSDPTREAAVLSRLVAAAAAGARVVWIRNTVREAQRAYGALAAVRALAAEERFLFHARFRGCDRRAVEERVLERFGKNAPHGGRILIATQVVEQSLDLDFDEMHSDLCPVDLLFQRAGRLHRHARRRPSGWEEPRLIVHGPSDDAASALRFGPSRYVYDAATLWITHELLRTRERLSLPDDIRDLVERVYHPESRATLIQSAGPELARVDMQREQELRARRARARQCCIPPTTADPDGEATLPDDEETVQAFTRDGMSVTLLPLIWDGQGARSLDAPESPAHWDIDAGRSDAWRLVGDLIDQTVSLPARGRADGVTVGAGTREWVRWRLRFSRFADETGLGSRVVPLPLTPGAAGFRGWLELDGRKRRALYTRELGLLLVSEKGEEQLR